MNNLAKILILQLLLALTLTLSLRGSSHMGENTFCWRDSYGRGIGQVPPGCPEGTEGIGLLCYDKCPEGMYRFVLDCHSICPEGLDDNGLFCRKSEYGRGSGYSWWLSDGGNDDGMISRCEADNGEGNCEKYMAMYYPKCKEGFHAFGCCICRPNELPVCQDFGLLPGIDLSCAKVVIIGTPFTGSCNENQEKDGGLCYPKCNDGFYGVGPVCWGNTPQGWTTCGMGVAKDAATCGSIVWDQVSSVGGMALSLATFGSASLIANAGKLGKTATEALQAKKAFQNLKSAVKKTTSFKNILLKTSQLGDDQYDEVFNAQDILNADPQETSVEDMVRISASVASVLDPTGIANTVKSYSFPKCSTIGL